MKLIKKLATGLLAAGMLLNGFGMSATNVTAEEVEGKIGFSISTLNNPFFVSIADGAEEKAKELGVDISIVDAGNDPAKQSTDIEDLISSGIKVLIVNPEDSASVGPSVQMAIDAGIKVISVDRIVEGADVDAYIGTDNVKAAESVGEYMLENLTEDDEVAVLEGVPGASSAIDRKEGLMNALDGKVNIVSSQTANYDRTEGMTVTENILQANPNLKVIFASNDEMALGAIEAVNAFGKVPGEDILVTGFDATDDAKQAVKDGTMVVTVEQKPLDMGKLAVETAVKMLKGETVEKEIPTDVTLLDKESVEESE
ncbi:substrate-binding domain-containing protein [Globicatella sanguinis]|uniref:substrate-binding domain-containing protein n=1 Tax=Globicatella sanguinis TaxID=13076 RepID=UPI000824294F|nr:substrate-binding domain-containing protein [Globicatella sanguinis]MDK7630933.1 substrate-binding domain-containing protein [Globicatella sanguinis]WIK67413.1 substrate-binding domain-containing protein [Globicatella sanguinis]WKT56818.1 substrate-binding domain-containing protein [Globicatella sanguinis]